MLILGIDRAHGADTSAVNQSVRPRSLDGVYIEAVEDYPNRNLHEFSLGFGTYPFNPYYTGINIAAGYIYHFTPTLSWEILNASYFVNFDSDITSQLADNFSIRPGEINRIQYIVGTNGQYDFLNGKFVFLREFIRYFRTSVIGGIGAAKTSKDGRFAGNLGFKASIFTSNTFSWNFEVRETFTIPQPSNFITFNLTTSLSF